MANLSYPDLKKRDNANKFVNKTFGRKGRDGMPNENNFMSDKGLFLAEYMEIGGNVYRKYDKNLNVQLTSAVKNPGIFLHGKLSGSRTKTKIALTKLFKSDEFGGQGPKGNAGHEFERQLDRRLQECLHSRCCRGNYDDESKHLIQLLSDHANSPVKSAELVGGANQSRPIKVRGSSPYIAPSSPAKHGPLLTDITVHHANKAQSYLSLKTSKTITFINSGVSKNYFTQEDMSKGMVTKKDGIALLEAFGLNNALFCKVFNSYGSSNVERFESVDVTRDVDKNKLKSFMRTAIGANYHMVHELNGKVYYWYVGEQENKKYADISGSKIIAHYGGKSGKGKRIDVEFENTFYKFKMNIRNKQSGVYPSHIMLDYESLVGVKKTVL